MKIIVIHGQGHKGVTYGITSEVLKNLCREEDTVTEFFLPKDGPDFCYGCFTCFMKGEENCPSADKVQPIAKAMEESDIIILDSPNYVMEMSGSMKNLMDHLAYRWITHRPHASMFKKTGIVICSSAGAPPITPVKSMAKQLRWMGVPKVYKLGMICMAAPGEDLKPKIKVNMQKKAGKIAAKARKTAMHAHPGIREKMEFKIFRNMQSSPDAAWNPMDRDWWVNQGWTKDVKPWK